MPADTPVAGYPAHAVATYVRELSTGGMTMRIQWTAQCGATGDDSFGERFILAGSCRKLELCTACFPGRNHNACSMNRPKDLTPKV